jgi:hypothetical protein
MAKMSAQILSEIHQVIREYKLWRGGQTYIGFTPIQFKEVIFNKYQDLAERAPTLFCKAVDGEFDKPEERERLAYLVEMQKQVGVSTYTEVSQQVNHKFSTDFGVYDVVDKLEKSRLKD